MQLRTLEDPDGHTWELFYMDMAKGRRKSGTAQNVDR